jgi:hypothetical protein
MKVNPNLFAAIPPKSPNDAGDARRAFEAMLSASAARSKLGQTSKLVESQTLVSPMATAAQDVAQVPPSLARPGRVLDIKV